MQLDFFDVPSPCIGVCQNDDKGYCQGCMRNREERFNWNNYGNDEKQKVIKRCLLRKKRKLAKPKEKSPDTPEVERQPSLLEPRTEQRNIDSELDFNDFEL
jgi:predicted Fe-S protein YdhL (DUF1289 family)